MASPSSFSSRNYKFDVFASFHGPDVRKTLLSHMRKQFNFNGITMFDDQGIERSKEIAPSLKNAIRQSRILIVILSKKYSSSGWCLDELVKILKGKKATQQIVMTIFYGVEPSDVRNQTGNFGIAFSETCARRTDEERQKWSKALKEVGNIAGEDFFRWDNEANMIEKIARDVSDKLNATPSREFDGMVGLESHLREMESLLDLDNDGVKMVAIIGPRGIGKTTIARALQSKLSNRFQLSCFVENIRETSLSGLHELRLQEQFLSKVLNQDGIRICHSGVIEERLCKQKVLITLDDVNHIKQLKALANETTWFGSGSRIVVTTENKELLQQHGINNTYYVGFPSEEEASRILCKYAFRKDSLYHSFERHVHRVTQLCGNLPLGLCVVGSSLRGKKEDEWEDVMRRLETVLNRDIEHVLRVGYESLDENEQTLFLHIAVFFNNRNDDLVKTMFAGSDFDVKYGLKILKSRYLIEITTNGEIIVMHRLLQQMGKHIIHKQDPWKSQILLDTREICDVLEQANGTRNVVGISFDITGIKEVSISKKAFKRMPNLRFLKVYKGKYDGNDRMHIPEDMEFPPHLKLLYWHAYPSKSFPLTFNPEYLVELSMPNSKVEKLWKGTQLLKNLKTMDLFGSKNLKELPDLTNATNLEKLSLSCCESLVEVPSSFSHLHNLHELRASNCINLQVIPAHMNLASLQVVDLDGCLRLRNIPVISTNMKLLSIVKTAVEGVPPSIRFCSRLRILYLNGRGNIKGVTHLPPSLTQLDLSNSDIERIPDCIRGLPLLIRLYLYGCKRLASLPELPASLLILTAGDCESLETIFDPLNTPEAYLNFTNCFKLCQQSRRAIIQRPHGISLLPGSEMPAEFDQRGKRNSLTIHVDGNRSYTGFMFCVVIHCIQESIDDIFSLVCRRKGQDDLYPVENDIYLTSIFNFLPEHLFIFHSSRLFIEPFEMNREIELEFSSESQNFEVIDCGAKILTEESIKGYYESGSNQVFEEETVNSDRIDCWSWLFLCCDLSKIVENIRCFGFRKKMIESENDDVSIIPIHVS